MAQPTKTLDSHSASRKNIHAVGDLHTCFCAKNAVLGVSTIATNTIYSSIITNLEQTSVTRPASPIVTTMPAPTNSVAFLPAFHTWSYIDYAPNNLMTWDQILLGQWTKLALNHGEVAETNSTSFDLDKNLAFLWS